jgi:hypothetical protein
MTLVRTGLAGQERVGTEGRAGNPKPLEK